MLCVTQHSPRSLPSKKGVLKMKKKLIATMVAGAVLSTGLIALTACGGGLSINKGEQVDAEGWTKAFADTIAAENFTEDMYSEATTKVNGEVLGVKIDISSTSKGEGKCYVDKANDTSYTLTNIKVDVSGDVPESMKEQYKKQEYKTENYVTKVDGKLYEARYNGYESEPAWKVVSGYAVHGQSISLLSESFATEENGEDVELSALYDAFTYSSGVYTATLYGEMGKTTVSVSVKGGHVVGISMEYSMENEYMGMKTTINAKEVCNLSSFGGTKVNPSNDAKKAIEDYKAQ